MTKIVVDNVTIREEQMLTDAVGRALAASGESFRMIFDWDETMRLVAFRRAIQAGIFSDEVN